MQSFERMKVDRVLPHRACRDRKLSLSLYDKQAYTRENECIHGPHARLEYSVSRHRARSPCMCACALSFRKPHNTRPTLRSPRNGKSAQKHPFKNRVSSRRSARCRRSRTTVVRHSAHPRTGPSAPLAPHRYLSIYKQASQAKRTEAGPSHGCSNVTSISPVMPRVLQLCD